MPAMPSRSRARPGLIVLLLAMTLACDQGSKALVRAKLPAAGAIFSGGILELSRRENPGAFLSAGAGLPGSVRFALFTLAVGAALLGALLRLLRHRAPLPRGVPAGAALVIGGGFGNLIDRLRAGAVTDFLIVRAGPVSTGIFNIADAAILSGGVLLALVLVRRLRTIGPGDADGSGGRGSG